MADSRQLRIVHLSDLHAHAELDEDHYAQERVAECLVSDLASWEEEKPIDLIVFSGDLAFDGKEEALRRGKSILLDPIREQSPGVPIVIAPGNHDVDRDLIDEAEELGLEAFFENREKVQQRLADDEKAARARDRLRAWMELAAEWDAGLEPEPIHPYGIGYRMSRNGLDVAIGAFDTAWRSQGKPEDRGRLIVGADSVAAFLRATAEADLAVVTFHHPLAWLADFDAQPTANALEGAEALVLTGHDHTADPRLITTAKGAALYCAAPCTYDSITYPNGYSVIDVDADTPKTTINLRRWQPNRDRFGRDVETADEDGSKTFSWPIPAGDALTVIQVPQAIALEPLAMIAQEQSLLADHINDATAYTVSDFVVAPRFWPVPHTEVFDKSVEREHRPAEVDPFEILREERVVIVAGGRMSGVTTSLLWLLEQHFQRFGTHFPIYVRADPRFSLGRIQGAINLARQRSGTGESPVIVAVDDVAPSERKALARLIRVVAENDDVIFVFGCHDGLHDSIARALAESRYKIPSQTLYLGHFGRRETRALVARIVGPGESDLVQRILWLVQRQRLPRNPLNLAALISVLMREPTLTAVNESGLLQSYVNVLLDNPLNVDPEKLNMDLRRREHLLQRIARHIVEEDASRINRMELEEVVIDYFKSIGYKSGSADQQVNSLIGRRVLVADETGVGFRYPALLHLFAAKAANEDAEFAAAIFGDMRKYAPVIKHLAGITRSDPDTLKSAMKYASAVSEAVAAGVEVSQFDLIKDKDGWSRIGDLEHARSVAERRPEPPTEDELDQIYDEAIDEPAEEVDPRPFESPPIENSAEQLGAAFSLAAAVLQSSELVEDMDLRTRALREVIEGWGVMTVLVSLEEDMFNQLHNVMEPLFAKAGDSERRKSMVEHIVRLFVVNLMSISLNSEAASVHHEKILEALLLDDDFMRQSSNALFATMMYASLEFAGWPKRMGQLIERYGGHPMVRETVRLWATIEYHHGDLSEGTRGEVEDVLVEIMTPEMASGGRAAIGMRADEKAKIREGLRRGRAETRWADAEAKELEEGESDTEKRDDDGEKRR